MWMYVWLFCLLQKVESIRLVNILVPEIVHVGEGVRLSCVYELEGDKLYSVKWYRDEVEFFRYVPSDKPSRLHFPVPGIQVDVERSANGTVFIQDVKTNTSGTYRCEISADAPSFQTILAEKMMAVEEIYIGEISNGCQPICLRHVCLILSALIVLAQYDFLCVGDQLRDLYRY